MLYAVIKPITRLAINILCRRVQVSDSSILHWDGPLLLAANHPNSFLDSILLNTLFQKPVWALARGDAFRNKHHARLLRQLNILPVYRTSEGTENLGINYQTFNSCVSLFKQKSIVTIYSEALCVNEWHLRPLKKGTARLAVQAWDAGIPLRVLPVGINYSSFRLFGKNVHINFGTPITVESVPPQPSDGLRYNLFNDLLEREMQKLVYEIPGSAHSLLEEKLHVPVSRFEKLWLFIPAKLGWILHWPLYAPIRMFTLDKFAKTGHCDSVISALLLLSYPFYLLFVWILLIATGFSWQLSTLFTVLFPLLAWCHVRIKPQFDHQGQETP